MPRPRTTREDASYLFLLGQNLHPDHLGHGGHVQYKDDETPWNAYKDKIPSIEFGDGTTLISAKTFRDCDKPLQVDLGATSHIRGRAFKNCHNLAYLYLLATVLEIGKKTRTRATGSRSLTIPTSMSVPATARD